MASFRFCRPDDADLLWEAVNSCYGVHPPQPAKISREQFNREIHLLNLWTSSCMVVLEGKIPIGVLTAAKREDFSLITRIGIHPNHIGKGYGEHLLTSLRDKMKILGPPHLAVELPCSMERQLQYFLKQGYGIEATYFDYHGKDFRERRELLEWVVTLEPDQIAETASRKRLSSDEGESNLAWERNIKTIRNSQQDLVCAGIAGMDGIEAYVCFQKAVEKLHTGPGLGNFNGEPSHERILVLGIGCGDLEKISIYMETLLTWITDYAATNWDFEKRPEFLIPKLSPVEMAYAQLEDIGFHSGEKYNRLFLHI